MQLPNSATAVTLIIRAITIIIFAIAIAIAIAITITIPITTIITTAKNNGDDHRSVLVLSYKLIRHSSCTIHRR